MFIENCQKISITQLKQNLNGKMPNCEVGQQVIELTTTDCNYGGYRYWFVCPECRLRIGTLYKKPLEGLWLCRHCHELGYRLTYYRRSQEEGFYRTLHQLN